MSILHDFIIFHPHEIFLWYPYEISLLYPFCFAAWNSLQFTQGYCLGWLAAKLLRVPENFRRAAAGSVPCRDVSGFHHQRGAREAKWGCDQQKVWLNWAKWNFHQRFQQQQVCFSLGKMEIQPANMVIHGDSHRMGIQSTMWVESSRMVKKNHPNMTVFQGGDLSYWKPDMA